MYSNTIELFHIDFLKYATWLILQTLSRLEILLKLKQMKVCGKLNKFIIISSTYTLFIRCKQNQKRVQEVH